MALDSYNVLDGDVFTTPILAKDANLVNASGRDIRYVVFDTDQTENVWPDRPDGLPYRGAPWKEGEEIPVCAGERITVTARHGLVIIESIEVGV